MVVVIALTGLIISIITAAYTSVALLSGLVFGVIALSGSAALSSAPGHRNKASRTANRRYIMLALLVLVLLFLSQLLAIWAFKTLLLSNDIAGSVTIGRQLLAAAGFQAAFLTLCQLRFLPEALQQIHFSTKQLVFVGTGIFCMLFSGFYLLG